MTQGVAKEWLLVQGGTQAQPEYVGWNRRSYGRRTFMPGAVDLGCEEQGSEWALMWKWLVLDCYIPEWQSEKSKNCKGRRI